MIYVSLRAAGVAAIVTRVTVSAAGLTVCFSGVATIVHDTRAMIADVAVIKAHLAVIVARVAMGVTKAMADAAGITAAVNVTVVCVAFIGAGTVGIVAIIAVTVSLLRVSGAGSAGISNAEATCLMCNAGGFARSLQCSCARCRRHCWICKCCCLLV